MTALPLIAVVVLAFFLPGLVGSIFFTLMALAMVGLGCYEAFTMLNLPCGRIFMSLCIVFSSLLVLGVYYLPSQMMPVETLFGIDILIMVLYLLCSAFPVFRNGPSMQMVSAYLMSLGVFMYIGWSLYFMSRVYFLQIDDDFSGRLLLFFIIAVTKMADVGAYIVGSSTAKLPGGNHKLSPAVSPKKSWEGLVGGTLFSVATAIGLSYIPHFITSAKNGVCFFNVFELVVIGVLCSVIGLIGDLIESSIKRATNFKDSGTIPGIGGVLDVLDSLIPISPIFFAYVLFKM